MQICLYQGISLSCKHPFLIEYAWDAHIIKVLSQTTKYILSFPILFSYFLTSDLTLLHFRQIILILSWKTCKIILICSVKLIFAHKIPHKPLVCRTPGVLTKLPKVIKKPRRHLCHQISFAFPSKWSPHFWRSCLCSKVVEVRQQQYVILRWVCLQQNFPSAQSIRLQRYKIRFSKVGFLFKNRTCMISKNGAENSASRMSANKLPLYIPSSESSEAAAFLLILF